MRYSQQYLPGFSGFGFCRKLIIATTPQDTDKAREHNGGTVFFRLWYYKCISRSGVNFM